MLCASVQDRQHRTMPYLRKAQSYAGLAKTLCMRLQGRRLVFLFLLYQYEPGQPPLLIGASLDPFRG